MNIDIRFFGVIKKGVKTRAKVLKHALQTILRYVL